MMDVPGPAAFRQTCPSSAPIRAPLQPPNTRLPCVTMSTAKHSTFPAASRPAHPYRAPVTWTCTPCHCTLHLPYKLDCEFPVVTWWCCQCLKKRWSTRGQLAVNLLGTSSSWHSCLQGLTLCLMSPTHASCLTHGLVSHGSLSNSCLTLGLVSHSLVSPTPTCFLIFCTGTVYQMNIIKACMGVGVR